MVYRVVFYLTGWFVALLALRAFLKWYLHKHGKD